MKLFSIVILLIALLGPGLASAADFDGSKVLICAPVEAIDCAPGESCRKGAPAHAGLPAFIRIDIAKMVMIGPKRTSPIASIERSEQQILLQGTELGSGWTIALDQNSGALARLAGRTEVASIGPSTSASLEALGAPVTIESETRTGSELATAILRTRARREGAA